MTYVLVAFFPHWLSLVDDVTVPHQYMGFWSIGQVAQTSPRKYLYQVARISETPPTNKPLLLLILSQIYCTLVNPQIDIENTMVIFTTIIYPENRYSALNYTMHNAMQGKHITQPNRPSYN